MVNPNDTTLPLNGLQERKDLKEVGLTGAVCAYEHIDVAEFDLDITYALEAFDAYAFERGHGEPSVCALCDQPTLV